MGEAKRPQLSGFLPLARPAPARSRPVLTGCIVVAGIVAAVLICGLAMLLLSVFASSARAHSFYPWECCSSQDCWPTGTDADAREPDPVGTASGWLLQDGTIVPYAAARPSPDGRFHVCRRGATPSGQIITPYSQPPCLWAPVPGS